MLEVVFPYLMLKLLLVFSVGFAVFLLYVGKVYDIAIFHFFVRSIDASQRLEQVVLLNHTVQVELL